MHVEKLMPGAYLITHQHHHILVGFPPEIVKVFLSRKLPIPTCWLLPDRKIFQGISQYSTEFPFYYFLFFSSPPKRPEKLTIIGTPNDLQINLNILRSALLGPSTEEMLRWQIAPEIATFLQKEIDSLALKDKNGKILPVEAVLNQIPLDKDLPVEIVSGLFLKHTDFNQYEFRSATETYSLKIEDEPISSFSYQLSPLPPYWVSSSNLRIIGGGNGFTPHHPCTGLLIEHLGIRLLVDAGPYIRQLVRHHGISLSQIHGLFLTHIHDDHTAGLTEFVQSGNKIDLFSTPEIARSAFQKLAMLYHQTEEQIAKNFRFVPLTPDVPIDYYGMTLTGHYAIHSVPCIGLKLALRSQGKPPFQILYPSDTLKLDRVHELRQQQVVSQERYDDYLRFLKQEVDLMVYDSGAGIIHADAKDLDQYRAKNYLCVHTDKISKEASLNFSLARGGDTYPLTHPLLPLSSSVSFEAFDFLTKLFPRVSSIWLKVLLEDAIAHSFNPSQVILRKNVTSSPIYLLLSGYLEILIDEPNETTRSIALYPGDIFSAQTLQNVRGQPNATIAARSIGLYLTFSADLFQNFLQQKPLKHLFQEYYEVRSFLENTPLVCDLDLHTRNQLASIAKGVLFPENTKILTQGEDTHDCYLIREGSVQVIKENFQHRKIVLGKNEIFGERALLLGQKRNATVIANSTVHCYQFDPLSFRKLCLRNHELRSQLEKLIQHREEVPS